MNPAAIPVPDWPQHKHRLEEDKRALQDERYTRFAGVLRTANAALAAIYRQLTGGQGDAYLAFSDDRLLLFVDGITLHVRRACACASDRTLQHGTDLLSLLFMPPPVSVI